MSIFLRVKSDKMHVHARVNDSKICQYANTANISRRGKATVKKIPDKITLSVLSF